MDLRFYIDPITDEPHIHDHGVDEDERIFCPVLTRIDLDAKAHVWQLVRPEADVICG